MTEQFGKIASDEYILTIQGSLNPFQS